MQISAPSRKKAACADSHRWYENDFETEPMGTGGVDSFNLPLGPYGAARRN